MRNVMYFCAGVNLVNGVFLASTGSTAAGLFAYAVAVGCFLVAKVLYE